MKADARVAPEGADVPAEAAVSLTERLRGILRNGGSFIPLVVLVIVAIIIVPGFLSKQNLQNLLTQNVTIGLVAAGMTLVIVGGAFDLSVGAIFALATVTYATAANAGPLPLAPITTVLACLGCGLVNGILVTRLRINSFVATLGSSLIIGGLAYIVTRNTPVFVTAEGFGVLGGVGGPLSVPWSAWILVALTVLMGLVLSRTAFGLRVSAMGASRRASQLVGVRVSLVQTMTFVIVAGLTAVAGMISTSQLSSATANVGATLPLDAIAAVVIGGTSLLGGRGSVLRTFVGVLILGILTNIFNSFGWDSSVQLVVKGAVVLFAVAFDALRASDR